MKAHDTVVLERRFVPKGTVVIREGDDGNVAYLVQSGRLIVFSEQGGQRLVLSEMGPGEIVGEMALICDAPRTASVEAIEDSTLILLSRHTIQEKLAKSDVTIRALVNMLTRRVAEGNQVVLRRKNSIDDLEEDVYALFETVMERLPSTRKRSFRESAMPLLESFLRTVRQFRVD